MDARFVTYTILNDIFFRRKTMDEAFAAAGSFNDLETRDRGFVRLLVTTVLKRAREMDAVLARYLHEPLDRLKPQQLLTVFRIGFAQVAFLDTKPHAAVDTTVDLAAQAGIEYHKPLVNAVMRRLVREKYPQADRRDAGRMNTPDWLWQQWVADYGTDTALDICAAHLDEAPVDFTLRDLGADLTAVKSWAEKLSAEILPTGSLRRATSGFVPSLEGFADGAWWVQNAAAAIPAQLFGDVTGKTVVDLCAAPGGKTAQLAAAGARVIAVDRSAPRIARLRENMTRLGFDVETVIADGAVWQPPEKVDAVLLDAPCSATGTIRHQPDVLWLKDIRDQEKLAALQKRLLQNAVAMLKPQGVLVYCTCSLQKAEGEKQTAWLLAQDLPVRLDPVADRRFPDIVTPAGDIRSRPDQWADRGGIDGFYIARFRRV